MTSLLGRVIGQQPVRYHQYFCVEDSCLPFGRPRWVISYCYFDSSLQVSRQLFIIINLIHYWKVKEHFFQSIETKKINKMKILLKRVYLLCDLELNCNEGSANFLFLASIFLLLFLELEVTVENCLTKIFLLSDSSDHQQALSILVF